ncbi:hypothetical protein AX14_011963, partial [Amanita brunnescens Koide BX004]
MSARDSFMNVPELIEGGCLSQHSRVSAASDEEMPAISQLSSHVGVHPNTDKWSIMAIEWADRDFDTKVESICHLAASIALPPDQEDLSALTIQLLLETKTVVNKKGEM